MQIRDYLKDGYLIEGTELCEETQTLEYKVYKYPFLLERLNQIYSLYSAWLNTTGGALFIGVVNDSCQVVGLSLSKTDVALCKELLSIEKANIIPSPPKDCFRMTFIPVKTQENLEKYVIRIEIMHGDKTTYYGRDTGYFNYLRMNQWNETENKFEKVKLKLDHVQRLDDDINNLHNQPKFEFDNSYEFPEIKTEKLSEEVLNNTLETQRKILASKLKSALERRLREGSLGYLNDLLGSVENPNIYHIQNIWNGLRGVEELQDTIIRKLEKMIPKVEEPAAKTMAPAKLDKIVEETKTSIPAPAKLDKVVEETKTSIPEQAPKRQKKPKSSNNPAVSLEKLEEPTKASTSKNTNGVQVQPSTVTAISKEVEKAIDNISKNISEHQGQNTVRPSEKIQEQKNNTANHVILQQNIMAALNIAPVHKEVEEAKNNNTNNHLPNSTYKQRLSSSNNSSVQGKAKESKVDATKNTEGQKKQPVEQNGMNTGKQKKRNGWYKKQKEKKRQKENAQNVDGPQSNSKQN